MLTPSDIANITEGETTSFLETYKGVFIFTKKTKTISRFSDNYHSWCALEGIPFGKNKGKHIIEEYFGKVNIL
jgi:hypothetical protein